MANKTEQTEVKFFETEWYFPNSVVLSPLPAQETHEDDGGYSAMM